MEKAYKVLKITQMVRPRDEGGVETYRRVMLKTKGGVVMSVDINEADFTAETAGPILLAAAEQADKILKL